jgi:RNA polymerase subunit RPABC4/transcription elongation factor Spt4
VRDIAAPFPVVDKPATAASLTCGQCGAAVLPDDRFCPKCGTPQMIACGHCGRVARAGDQFCAQCGQSLPAPDGQASLQS